MNNINILAIDGNTVRFWGFEDLHGTFTYRMTLHGIILNPVKGTEKRHCIIENGRCSDKNFFNELKNRGFTYGTLIPSAGGYIASLSSPPNYTLEELVNEYEANLLN